MTRYRKLTEEEKKKKDDLSNQLKSIGKALNEKVEQFNKEIDRLWETVETSINEYNKALENSKEFVNEIVCKKNEVCEEFSPEWGESFEADAFNDWLREWQNYDDIEDVTLDCPAVNAADPVASINEAFDALPLEIEDPNPKKKSLPFKRRVVQNGRKRVPQKSHPS